MESAAAGERSILRTEVLERMRQNKKAADVLPRLANTYIQDAECNTAKIEAGLEQSDWDSVKRAAHALKSASAAIGATQVLELCAAIERTVTANPNENLHELVRCLRLAVREVTIALAPYRRRGAGQVASAVP
jgi:HPt (histidine-containing phosphotransfer) domain-containing protein